jgi:hypothetical protein
VVGAVDAAVWSVVVVPAQPAGEGFDAVVACWVDEAVGPFALQDADEGFGLAVGPGRVGPGADVADVVPGEQVTEGVASIASAIVGEDAANRGALFGVGGDQALGEAGAVLATLAWS